MSELYPEESQRRDVMGHLEELRRRILICLAGLTVLTVFFFTQEEALLGFVKSPLRGWGTHLIFIGPAEPFIAYVKIALLAGFAAAFPLILHQAWAFFSPALPRATRRHAWLWLALALALFALGAAFSYVVALPTALDFLIGFGKKIAVPNLTMDQYVSFFTAFMLAGGLIFEIPLAAGFLTDIGLIRSSFLKKKRPVALVVILIAAAILTPTQDIFNMMLFAAPMELLYECGILLSAAIEKRKKGTEAYGKNPLSA
ncbi:MAG: twin-arginine translocase subunit TatC [Candidatus Omnitrophota bacterium]|jgi:sec-independent protein translocase protein TatC